eukprot:gene2297-17914_t
MPGGTSWRKYIMFMAISVGAMFSGASVVHHYYKPNLEIPDEPADLGQKEYNSMISLKSDEDIQKAREPNLKTQKI